ncbi:MAG: hypothetical protein ACK5KL_02600 [Dysgonomonas sp.]
MKQKIEKQYINSELRQSYRNEIESANEFINGKLKDALISEGLEFNIDMLDKLSKKADAIRDIMTKHKQDYISNICYIPSNEKERINNSFNDTINNLLPINSQFYLLKSRLGLSLETLTNGAIVFNQSEVKVSIDKTGVRTFSQVEIEYLNLILDAAETLKKIDEYERTNNIIPYVLGSVIFLDSGRIIPTGLTVDVRNNIDIPKKFASYASFEKRNNNQ